MKPIEQDAEESHTAVGVHRLAPRVGEPTTPTIRAGRGVLEQPGTGSTSSTSSREGGRGGGEYELVATREEEGERKQDGDVSDTAAGIRRVVSG